MFGMVKLSLESIIFRNSYLQIMTFCWISKVTWS